MLVCESGDVILYLKEGVVMSNLGLAYGKPLSQVLVLGLSSAILLMVACQSTSQTLAPTAPAPTTAPAQAAA